MRRSPSLSSLRLFLLVARHRSFTGAGRDANVSQPALSRTIRILEEQIGARLFDRDSRNVRLTPAGETLLPIVERLVADFDDTFEDLSRSLNGQSGRVVVGALPSVAAVTLPPLLASFRVSHPHVEVILRDGLSGALYEQMRDRRIDIAIATAPDHASVGFDPLLRDAMVLVASRGSEFDDAPAVTWKIFADHPFIAMIPESSVRGMTDEAFARSGVQVRQLYECAHLATVGALIEAGLGITALPASTLGMLHEDRIVSRPLHEPCVERTIGLAYPTDRTLSPAAEAFRCHFTNNKMV